MKKETIKVEGMSCGHCEIAVQDAIRKLPGINKAKANKRKKQAVIDYDESQVSLEQIVSAVNAIGYDAILQ
ncbi:MAG: heavy-metal-associated domain-containing protein [Lachnospiraceae bacterium]